MLKVKTITKKYSDKKVIDNFSMNVSQGEILALYGRNGSGKTTLITVIGGLTDFEGEIEFKGIPLRSKGENYQYLENIGILLNDQFSYDFMTVDEFIELNINLKDVDNKKDTYDYKNQLIKLLFLEDFQSELMKNLSLGTKQKVMLLLSLIHKPSLILLDEPLVNLDTKSKENIINFLKEYVEENVATLIFSSHDINLINNLATTVVNMKDLKSYEVGESWC